MTSLRRAGPADDDLNCAGYFVRLWKKFKALGEWAARALAALRHICNDLTVSFWSKGPLH